MLNAVKLQPCHATLVNTVYTLMICNVQRLGPAGDASTMRSASLRRSGTYTSRCDARKPILLEVRYNVCVQMRFALS